MTETEAPAILMVSGTLDGVTLTLDLDASTKALSICAARHDAAGEARAVLDALCSIIIGRPIQEAADHGVIHVMGQMAPAKVPGILTPRNAGPAFLIAERLLRRAFAAAQDKYGIGYRENRWNSRPGTAWVAKSEAEQAAILKRSINAFLRERGRKAGDLWITGIEKSRRVTVAFAAEVPCVLKPEMLLSLERCIRKDTGEPLELFMEEMKDANKIRRL